MQACGSGRVQGGGGEGGLDAHSQPLGRGSLGGGGGSAWDLDIYALHRYPNNISFKDVDIYLQISLLKISFEDVDIYLKNKRYRYLSTFRYNQISKIYRISLQIYTNLYTHIYRFQNNEEISIDINRYL